ncbi:MAG TPA: GNAT family N-acetyltransferase [Solirubrobacterales bacterium]|nr:GNAT family N-acetyltransferase [Solirubrobacterales bacterium]
MPIRPASEADIPALLPLMRGYADFYQSNPSDAGLEEMARTVIAEPDTRAYLLVATADDGEVVGFAACAWKWSSLRGARVVVLDDLFVAEAARGQGHADALITAVADVARRHGAAVVNWLTAPDNHRAQAVYDRLGGTSEPFLEYELELG